MAQRNELDRDVRRQQPNPLELARDGTRAAGAGAAAGAALGALFGAASGAMAGVVVWSMATLGREAWRRYQNKG